MSQNSITSSDNKADIMSNNSDGSLSKQTSLTTSESINPSSARSRTSSVFFARPVLSESASIDSTKNDSQTPDEPKSPFLRNSTPYEKL